MENDKENISINEKTIESVEEKTNLSKEERIANLQKEQKYNYVAAWIEVTLKDVLFYYPFNGIKKVFSWIINFIIPINLYKKYNSKEEKKKFRIIVWIPLVILLYLFVGIIVYFYFFYNNNKQNDIKNNSITESQTNNAAPVKIADKEEANKNELYNKVINYIKTKDYNESVKILKILIEQGDTDAQKTLFGIAGMFLLGKDLEKKEIERNYPLAMDYLKYLSTKGNEDSKNLLLSLGCCFWSGKDFNGENMEKNFTLAGDCFNFLAELGYNPKDEKMPDPKKGLLSLGCMYLKGEDFGSKEKIEVNIPEAVKYLKLSASYGDKDAQVVLDNLKKDGLIQEEIQNNISCEVNENKIVIALQGNSDQKALGAAKVVQDFYADYLNKNVDLRISWATNKYLTPKTRQIFSLLSFFIDDCDYIINIADGQDFGNLWKINRVDVADDTAVVNLENSWDGNDARSLKIKCKYINTKWFIEDIDAVTNRFYSFLNFNQNLAVVTKNELIISSNKHILSSLRTPFFYRKNRIIPLKYFDFSKNNYYIDFNADGSNNLSNLIDSSLIDYDWTVKAEDIIPFNFFNKIKKGEDKYLAYIVLGEPSEDSSNKLFYSPDDYISYDKDGKITSWVGFEDLKEFFDDGIGSNNQNIGYINAKSGINLRKEPSTKAEKVCGLAFNTKVMILDENGPQATFENIYSNWYLVTNGTRVGWAFGGFIRMTK